MNISMNNITKYFNDRPVLSDFSLQIEHNEYICLKGQSGCGKTTILNILSGMEKADSGTIVCEGIVSGCISSMIISKETKKLPYYRKKVVSYAPCGNVLLDALTVYENICFDKPINKDFINTLLETLQITDIKNKYPYMISSGEYKRAVIARTIATDTPFMIFDEPTSNLDGKSAEIIANTIVGLEGKGIVVATHDERLMKGKIILCENGD